MTRDPVALAEIEHDMQQTKRENERGPGEEFCCHCGFPFEEGDLRRLGGDGDWECQRCIVGRDDIHRLMRRMVARMAGALSVSRHPLMREVAKEAEELLERSR